MEQETTTEVVESPAVTTEQVTAPEAATAAPEDVPKQAEERVFTQAELEAKLQARLAKQERQHLRELREITQQIRQTQQEPQQADAPPQRDKFATDEQWLDARDEWRDAKRDREIQRQRQAEQEKASSTKTEKLYAEASRLPGFDRESFDELWERNSVSPMVAQALVDSDVAPQLMAYMSSNPEDIARISKLTPARQAAELGKLEAKLSLVKQHKEPPAPIKTVSGGGSVSNNDPRNMPMPEYLAWRKANGAKWAT